MKKNWSVSIMLIGDRIGVLKRPAYIPRREETIRMKSDVSGKMQDFTVWSVTYDMTKRTIILQVIEKVR